MDKAFINVYQYLLGKNKCLNYDDFQAFLTWNLTKMSKFTKIREITVNLMFVGLDIVNAHSMWL